MQHAHFAHLHVHTYYSLLDGALSIDQLASASKKFKLPAVAITDSANLFGAVEFYKKLSAEGIKPIIGAELYLLTQGSRTDKQIRRGEGFLANLVLLVKNHKGYQNLCRLISSGHLEGFYYKPRIDKEILKEYSEGLIALSGCLKGEVPRLVSEGRVDEARKAAEWYANVFDDGRFYVEIMDQGLPNQSAVNRELGELAKECSLPLVATNDCRYLEPADQELHEVLRLLHDGRTFKDAVKREITTNQFHFRSPEEMRGLFSDLPEAIENTWEIASKCNFEFDFKTYHFPRFHPPKEVDLPTYLTEKVEEGFQKRVPLLQKNYGDRWEGVAEDYRKRLEAELTMIKNMGFAGYFLIVADFIEFAKASGIAVGPGRGSVAGSLVAYALEITDIDPIPHNLIFERFLNPERISMPDMDIDFCVRQRDKVIEYVAGKYGNVSQIITFGKMKARAVVRDVGRVLGMAYGDVDRIAKMIPMTLGITLEKALEVEPQLKKLSEDDPEVGRLVNIAKRLEGFPRHASTHAAGVVISDQPLVNFLPLSRGQNEEVITQFDMKAVEAVGLIKFDFLGLKTLTLIEDTVKLVKEKRGEAVAIESIDLKDKATYDRLTAGDTKGIFQLESAGMTDLIVRLRPNTFEDIVALVALFRPGPLGSGMVDDFIDRKNGRKEIRYELPQLEPILKETYGVMVYQEQVMQIASTLASFTPGDADLLRRAMGKKKPAEMATQRDKFVKGAQASGIRETMAEKTFNLMAEFAGYGFNKSHSAAYAMVSYRTAYLKTHYPIEFMAALLTSEMGNTDKVLEYMNDCRGHGIKILPPDVNESTVNFTVSGEKEIRFGLAAVKNVGHGAIEAIVEARAAAPFTSLADFCERVDLKRMNRRVLESLIKCGAMDAFEKSRVTLFEMLEGAMAYGASMQKEREGGQASLFTPEMTPPRPTKDVLFGGGEVWSEHQILSYEKETLGFYLTGHPLAQYEKLFSQYTSDTLKNLSELEIKREVRFAGIVTMLREIMTRKGEKMAFVTFEDLTATIETIVFSDVYKEAAPLLKGDQPLFCVGTSEIGEESVRVIAKEIFLVADLPTRMTKSVHFHLSTTETDQKQLSQLKSVISRYPGKCPAYIHLSIPEKSETVMALPGKLCLSPDLEMVKSLEKIFGHNITRFQS